MKTKFKPNIARPQGARGSRVTRSSTEDLKRGGNSEIQAPCGEGGTVVAEKQTGWQTSTKVTVQGFIQDCWGG